MSGASQINGSFFQDSGASTIYNNILSTAAFNTATLSTNTSSLTGTTSLTSNFSLSGGRVSGSNSSFSITATNNDPVVLELTNFVRNNSSFTLIGQATSRFIFDVGDDFALNNGSLVTFDRLSDPENVILRIGNAIAMSGASEFNGILLVSNSTVAFSVGSTVDGHWHEADLGAMDLSDEPKTAIADETNATERIRRKRRSKAPEHRSLNRRDSHPLCDRQLAWSVAGLTIASPSSVAQPRCGLKPSYPSRRD